MTMWALGSGWRKWASTEGVPSHSTSSASAPASCMIPRAARAPRPDLGVRGAPRADGRMLDQRSKLLPKPGLGVGDACARVLDRAASHCDGSSSKTLFYWKIEYHRFTLVASDGHSATRGPERAAAMGPPHDPERMRCPGGVHHRDGAGADRRAAGAIPVGGRGRGGPRLPRWSRSSRSSRARLGPATVGGRPGRATSEIYAGRWCSFDFGPRPARFVGRPRPGGGGGGGALAQIDADYRARGVTVIGMYHPKPRGTPRSGRPGRGHRPRLEVGLRRRARPGLVRPGCVLAGSRGPRLHLGELRARPAGHRSLRASGARVPRGRARRSRPMPSGSRRNSGNARRAPRGAEGRGELIRVHRRPPNRGPCHRGGAPSANFVVRMAAFEPMTRSEQRLRGE